MDIVDAVVILACLGYAVGGYRNGAVVGFCSLAGFIGGAILGAKVARPLGAHVASGQAQVVVAVASVLVIALLGQLLGVFVGGRIRASIRWPLARAADSGIGAILSVISVLLVAWMVALPLASSPFPQVSSQVRRSAIVGAVDGVMPNNVRDVYSSLRRFIDRSGFPPVFGDLQSTRIVDVPPPDGSLLNSGLASHARASTVKIRSTSPSCARETEGSGFVYAPEHVLTNAHVVAGSSGVRVEATDGSFAARVVQYDPERDVAVLYVPGLQAAALPFAQQPAATGDGALVLGYPEDGPFDVEAARIRERGEITGRDIYGENTVRREIYSIRSTVRSGNSGGPLLSSSGQVLGMVFATALDAPQTGFALTDAEISSDARTGLADSAAVSTGRCD